jgi:hypothetical protein
MTPAPDARLPDTGVGLELERMLSPPFVRGARYGTRCSTVVLIDETQHRVRRTPLRTGCATNRQHVCAIGLATLSALTASEDVVTFGTRVIRNVFLDSAP